MIRRNAQKGIQIARRGYLSFVEKGNIGVVNYTQTGTTRTFDSVRLTRLMFFQFRFLIKYFRGRLYI